VTTATKTLKIKGKSYVIKRFGFEEGASLDGLIEANKDKLMEQQAITVYYGTVEPKFESIQAVKVADREVVLHLWLEINRLNQYETSFLSLLKNLPSQVSQPEKTLTQ
jgi:hypothetical protein